MLKFNEHKSSVPRLNYMFSSRWVKIVFVICIVFLNNTKGFSQYGNEDELKKQAAKHFEDEEYAQAYKAYSQLVSNYPKDPNYNYRLGVCMLFNESDKKKCYSYLEFANKNIQDAEKEARFYLAKAYHSNFRFDDAIKLYTQYKEIASSSMAKKLKVDREIQSCKNGKRLLSDLNELVVLEKKQLAEGDYFRSYNLSDIGGKLLVKPEDFITSNDKKKKNKSIVYLPKSNDRLFYSSYGTSDNKDIFIVRKLPNGEWSKPENLGLPVNTEFDEDYPFLHPNGKVLYFASQGHNSMGGYDIFKSELDEATGKWKAPVNMDFPINTPNDDILFVTDSLEKTAYFSSTRQSPNGKIDVYKINTERRPPEFIYIKGNVLKKENDQRQDSKITIKDINAGADIGSFQADVLGNYLIKIPNGGKFIFTFETIGFTTQSEGLDVPVNNSLVPYRQLASYNDKKLVLQNLFTTNKDDENAYLHYLEIIEQKSKMDVNASDFTSSNASTNTNNTATNNNTATSNNSNNVVNNNVTNTNNTNNNETNSTNTNPTNNSNLSNTQLEKIAFADAEELKLEAIKLKADASDAFTFVENQKFEASQKNKEALIAIEAANNEQNINKKDELQNKANQLQEEAKKLENQSKLAENIARNLENDANLKQKEADLQLKYAEQLKEVNSTKNNKEALAKLQNIQKELEALSKEKNNVNELSNSINADIKRKEEELTKLEPLVKKNQNEVTDLEAEIKNVDLEINNTKDKDLKNNLIAQRDELNNELAAKKNELKTNKDKFDFVNNEKETLKSQADFANNMISQVKADENLAAVNINNNSNVNNTNINKNESNTIGNEVKNASNNTNNNNSNNNVGANNPIEFTNIKEQKESKINELNKEPESSKRYENQKQLNNELLVEINKEIESKKAELKIAKKADEKKNLTTKIKELEDLKTDIESDNTIFDSKIAYQKNLESNSNNNVATKNENNTSNNNNNNPNNISTTNSSNVTEQINELNELNKTGNNNQELFTPTFTNNEALQLKNKAESDYLAAVNKGKISETKLNEIKNSSSVSTPDDFANRSSKLNAEIYQLYKEASNLRKEANSLTANAKADKINKAKEKEALSANKKLELAQLIVKENEAKFELNQKIIDEYIAANGNKSNLEILKAGDLIKESSTLYKQAVKIEEEANAEQDIAAKAASYGNVEEKEMEALAKQEQAIAILKKNNTSFEPKSKSSSSENNVASVKLDEVKREIQQKNNDINNSLVLLSEANEKEYSTVLNSVSGNNNPEINQLKSKAEELKNKAEKEKQESIGLQSASEKNEKLVNSNKLYQEAINQLKDASKIPAATDNNPNNVATNINNTGNNTNENNNTNNVATNNNTENNDNENNNSNNVVTNNNNAGNNTSENNNTNNVTTNNNNSGNNTNESNNTNNIATNNNNTGSNTNESNNVSANNTVSANGNNNVNNAENNTNNTATTNTIVPNSSKLSPTEIAKVKESEEYKNYIALENDAKKYNDIAINESDKATAYYNQAGFYLKESNDLRIETDKMLDGEDRKLKLDQATKLDHLANEYKAKGDSVRELASNTSAFADSKKMESEAYATTLDKKTMDKILAVNDNTANNNSTNNNSAVANNTTDNNNTASANKFEGSSDGFKTNATKLENDLKTFENAEESQANLEAQNQILEKYNSAIDKEIASENEKLATANQPQKTAINNRIKALESQKITNNKSVAANKTKITTIVSNNGISNNSSNNNNTNNNSNNTTNNNNTVNNSNNTASNNNIANNNSENITNNTSPISGTDLKISNNNAYSANKPIPIDEKLPAGIIFAVQIGAFKNQIPNDLFKGLSPLRGETTDKGLIRYQAGRFIKFEYANGVKNDLKKLGYKDAFVVVYKDGQKIPLGEAFNILKGNGVNITVNPNETAGITINVNVPSANTVNATLANNNSTSNNTTDYSTANTNTTNEAVPVASKEISGIQGMLFTVQIGVYSNNVSASQLFNLNPIYREQIPSGNFRYTAGIYSNIDKVKADRQKVNDLGIKDAFVSAYLNGQRIKISDALAKLGSGENVLFPTDSPIQFNSQGSTITTTPPQTTTPVVNNTTTNNNKLQPFSNGVTQGPQATPENGVKIGDEGVTFKVQIGAYKNQVPANVANNFLKIKQWPIQANQINGLYIYSIGSFVDAKSARPLLENAKQNGIADAYITVYKDGKKLYGAAASELLNR